MNKLIGMLAIWIIVFRIYGSLAVDMGIENMGGEMKRIAVTLFAFLAGFMLFTSK